MRRFCILAVLAAGSTVLRAQPTGPPSISSLSQSSAPVGSCTLITITGTNFVSGDVAQFIVAGNLDPMFTTVVSTTQITAQLPTSLATAAGNYSIQVQLPTTFNAPPTSNAVPFTLLSPVISSLVRSYGTAGAAAGTQLIVNGSNFALPGNAACPATGSGVNFGSTPVASINVVSSSQIIVNLPAMPSTPGPVGVTVVNQRIASNTAIFTVDPAPTISTLVPAFCTVSTTPTAGCTNATFPLQINGTDFPGGALLVNGAPNNQQAVVLDGMTIGLGTVINSGQITAAVPPSVLTPGTHFVSVVTYDGVASNRAPFAVYPAPVLTSAQPNVIGLGAASTLNLTGANFLPGMKVQWQGPSGSALIPPSGLSATQIVVSVPSTLTASGGTATVSVLSTDSVPVVSNALSVTVSAALTITTPPFPSMQVGSPLSTTFAAKGGTPPYTFSSSGTLPPGTQFSGSTLSGTLNTPGTFSFTVTVTDGTQATASQAYTITVTGMPLSIVTTSPQASGQVGVAYKPVQFQAAGGVGPYSWSAGSVPAGMSFSPTGVLSGTPTTAGTFTIAVTVTDSVKASATGNFALTITGITITTPSLPSGSVGTAYSGSMAATGGVGTLAWTASGLPAGISLSVAGTFSGTPTAAGAFMVAVTVTDSAGNTASRTYGLTVNGPPPKISITGPIPAATMGSSFNLGFSASGGVPPYLFSATGLPAGLTFSGAGLISGSPTVAGTFNVTVTVTDFIGQTDSTSFTINVALPTSPPLSFTGISTSINPGSQSSIGVSLGSPYPVAITVNLSLTFSGTDPAVQFATGGLTAIITIPAGQTAGSTTIGVQTGTVAGTITITAKLLAGTTDVTPSPAPQQTITVPATAPVISTITAVRNSTGFTVTITGYSSTRALSTANFTFSGTNLGTTSLAIQVDPIFSPWYQSSTSSQYGSNFTYTQPFTTSNPQAVTSVSVTLVNAAGTSASASATLQ